MQYHEDTKRQISMLKARRANLDDQIKRLEDFLALSKADKSVLVVETPSVSVRGGVDIRPTVRVIFQNNGNQATKVKDIVAAVMKEMKLDKQTVERKMEYAKNNILEKDGIYGMYRLKTTGGV